MKIPATVVTGFLGSGKTTLIRHLIGNARGRRLALIINEFGDLGFDRELLLGCGIAGCEGDDVIDLANGCICCTVADEFLPTMEMLLGRAEPPDHMVIETSGLALPKPLVKAFNWPEVRSRITVDGVVTVVDASAVAAGRFAAGPQAAAAERADGGRVDHDAPLEELFEDQLACADMVVLNKIDGVDAETLAEVRSGLEASLRPGVKVLESLHGALEPMVVLGLAAAAEAGIDGRFSHHDGEEDHDHDEFVSFIAAPGPVADPAALEARIREAAAAHDVLRVKGFVDVPGKAMRHVIQAVGARVQRYYDRPWRSGEVRSSELVVIAERGTDIAAVSAVLAGVPGSPA
ncbi:MAG TPA: cobalamin biosynthesis protein CobW [Rhodospirillales bacterium]|nr:cobalamin biosynthesis protein CobW [Rhodospirillales bacterium]